MENTKINPYFEVNGNRYEIKPTRYLISEFDNLRKQSNVTDEMQSALIKMQNLTAEYEKANSKLKGLEDKFFDTFEEEDERRYKKCKAYVDDISEKLVALTKDKDTFETVQKASIDNLEKMIIIALQEQYTNGNYEIAKQIWTMFVEDNGNDIAVEWLQYMAEELFSDEKQEQEVDENSFIAKMRAKNSSKANN